MPLANQLLAKSNCPASLSSIPKGRFAGRNAIVADKAQARPWLVGCVAPVARPWSAEHRPSFDSRDVSVPVESRCADSRITKAGGEPWRVPRWYLGRINCRISG